MRHDRPLSPCHNRDVARRPTTVRLNAKLMSEVQAAATRVGATDDDVIKETVRRFSERRALRSESQAS